MKMMSRRKPKERNDSPTKDVTDKKEKNENVTKKPGEPKDLSDISHSTDGGEIEQVDSIDEGRADDYEKFERQLRHKHSKACKAMAVS